MADSSITGKDDRSSSSGVDLPQAINGAPAMQPGLIIHHRSERSFAMHLLHLFIKPISSHILKMRQVYPPGSPRLEPPKRAKKWCNIEERQVDGIWVYDLTAKKETKIGAKVRGNNNDSTFEKLDGEGRKRIYYFAGGGWQMPASGEHWGLVAEIVRRMPNTVLSLVSYPLAPNSPACVSFPQLEVLYESLLEQSKGANERVILAGDSAGGTIVLCLVMSALARAKTTSNETSSGADAQTHKLVPAAIFTIAPSTDLSRTNPQIEVVASNDPLLTIPFIRSTAQAWCNGPPKNPVDTPSSSKPANVDPSKVESEANGWPPEDPRVSPIQAQIELLVKHNVQVHGVTGGYDVLSPDGIVFRDKCKAAGVQGEWLHWEKQMHCFPLAFGYGFKECREAVEWIVDVLQRT